MTAWTSTINDTVGAVDSGTDGYFADALGLLDSTSVVQVVATTWSATINDTVGLVDSGTNTYSAGDWVGLVDSISWVQVSANGGAFTESVGNTDTTDTFVYNVSDDYTDQLGMTDSMQAALGSASGVAYTAGPNEAVGLSDSMTAFKFLDITVTDRIDFGDTIGSLYTPLATWNVNVTDPLGLLDDASYVEPIRGSSISLITGTIALGWYVLPSKVASL